jgi:hypothetical protein
MDTEWDEYYVVVGFELSGASLAPIEVTFLSDGDIAAGLIDDDAEELAAVCLYKLTPACGQPGGADPVLVDARGDVPERWRKPSVNDIFNTSLS